MSLNTLFLTFSYFVVFNMFKFNDFFARRRESGFTGTIWNLKRSFKENPTFPIYIQLLCLLQLRENSFPKTHCCVKISATTTAHNVYRNNYLQKIFFLYLNDFIFDTLISRTKIKPIFKWLDRLPFATPGTVY